MTEKKILSSWKEIANYLGVNSRTAQRWEKLGLPIYRVDESQKTSILAYAEEIDEWLKEQNGKEAIPPKKRIRPRKLIFIVVPLFLVVTAIFVFVFFIPIFMDKTPAGFKIDGSELKIQNKFGKKLWDYSIDGKFFREAYEPERRDVSKSSEMHNIFFEDIDRDGHVDVVFAVQTEENIGENVVCFDHRGHPLWTYPAGREIRYGNQDVSADFNIQKLRVVDLDRDGFFETIMIACHKIFHPARVLVLDHRGKIKGEYWNSGHLVCSEFVDLNGDGFTEILLGGLNNNYDKACLVVLDCRTIEGSSPNEKGTRYHSDELKSGTEKYYVLFPNNEVGQSIGPDETILTIDLFENARILTSTKQSRVLFELDYSLHPTMVLLGDEFKFRYRQLKKEGKIDVPLDSFDANQIESEILYWDGKAWVHEPTITRFWKNYDD